MAKKKTISFKEFLENIPPNFERQVDDLTTGNKPASLLKPNKRQQKQLQQDYDAIQQHLDKKGSKAAPYLRLPELDLHCETCGGPRRFEASHLMPLLLNRPPTGSRAHLDYFCSNCQTTNRTHKYFALLVVPDEKGGAGLCQKYGEYPLFGPPLPTELLALFDEEGKEGFHKGRFCEHQGLGAGALAHYTRMVDSQLDSILDEVWRASKKLEASPGLLKKLKDANSLEDLKGVKLPSSLLILGKLKPLKILHETIGKGTHGRSDGECLHSAQTIRTILTELSKNTEGVLSNQVLDEMMV